MTVATPHAIALNIPTTNERTSRLKSPAKPSGAATTTHTKKRPRYIGHAALTLATATLKNVSSTAPTTGPKNVPAPPMTVATSTPVERASPTLSDDTSSTLINASTPAMPAKYADTTSIVKRTRAG